MDIDQIKEGAASLESLAEFNFDLPEETQEPKKEEEAPDIDFTEKKEEEKVKEVETPKKKEDPKLDLGDLKPNHYSKLAQKMISKGDWLDAEIENEDGTKTLLSEMKDLDEEQYLEILENQKTFKDEEIKEKYTSVEGLDESKKRLINIIKQGGDLTTIFQNPNDIQRPFEEVDLEDENTCANIVYRQHLANGLDEKQSSELTKLAQKDFSLDDKAKKIVEYHQGNYDKRLVEVEKELQEEKVKEQEELKSYRSSLSKGYKEQGVQETLSKRLIDLATRENKEGQLEVDSLYEKMMEKPETAQELIHFLADKESYLKLKSVDIKRKDNIQTMKTISFVPKDKNKKAATNSEEPQGAFSFDLP